MIARTDVAVAAGAQLTRLRCQPPLTVRRVHGARDTCALCLVGTAAGPLAGDDLTLRLDLAAGSRASLVAAGASIAQGRPGRGGRDDGAPARLAVNVSVAGGADLDADPGPLVVCAGARVEVSVSVELAADATIRWRELIVLGRTGAPAGAVTVRWDVTRAGRPVLRQFLDLTDRELMSWPGLIGCHRVVATALVAGPLVRAELVVLDATAMAQPLDDHAVLVTVLADDAATAQQRLSDLVARIDPRVVSAPVAVGR